MTSPPQAVKRLARSGLVTAMLLAGGSVWGQQPKPDGADASPAPASAPVSGGVAPAVVPMDEHPVPACEGAGCAPSEATSVAPWLQEPVAVGAVDGSGLVALDARAPNTFSMQLGTMGGYDSALLDKEGLSSSFVGGQAALAKLFSGSRSQLLLQDAVSGTHYSAGGGALQGLNTFSGAYNRSLSQTWNFETTGLVTFGNDSLRAVAPIVQDDVGGVSGVSPNAATFGLYSGNVLTSTASMALSHQTSQLSGWSYSANDTYLRYFSYPQTENTLTGRADYLHSATRSVTYGFYGIGIHQSGTITCSSGGGGASISYRPSRMVQLAGSGGPVSGSDSCGRAVQLLANGSISMRPTEKASIFVSVDRRPNNGLLPQAVWMTSYTGGVQYIFKNWLSASSSYSFTNGGSTGTDGQSSQAQYIAGSAKLLFGGNFWQEISLRHYNSVGFQGSPGETVLVSTLWWSPQRRDDRETARR